MKLKGNVFNNVVMFTVQIRGQQRKDKKHD